jgi:protein TonB
LARPKPPEPQEPPKPQEPEKPAEPPTPPELEEPQVPEPPTPEKPPEPEPPKPEQPPEPQEPKPQTEPPKPKEPAAKPKPSKRAQPSKETEPVPEFKDDFQQLSRDYSSNAAEAGPAAPASSAKPDTGVHPGAILNINPRIHYPLDALRKGQRGVVIVLIHISTDGHTSSVDLLKSSGYEELDNQVLGAVQHWRFTPPKRGNTPVESTYKHTVIFGADMEVIDDFATHWQQIKLQPAGAP